MLVKELQNLIHTPSVCGYEHDCITYLEHRGKDHGIPTRTFPGYGVIFGSPTAPTYYIAHIDEVGGWVSYVDDTTIHLETKGRISPSMLIGRDIQILTKQGIVPGLISSNTLLDMQETDIHNLHVSVDPTQREQICRGDAFRYTPQYQELPSSLITTGLDNKLGVVIAMELALKNKDNNFLHNNAICLCTQEEDKNQGAMYFMQQYMPKRQIVLDISPMSKEIHNNPHQGLYIAQTADYILDTDYQNICIQAGFEKVSTTLGILNRSEAMQYQNITKGVGINLNIPVYNYHLGSYFVYKDAIEHFEKCLDTLITNLPTIDK